ncbi:MAG: 4Fe-4S dicluster domain-containing protein [bacterium]
MPIDNEVINRLKKAGIVGLGGGGFPTYAKWREGAEIVIANGAECEPLLIKDQFIMENCPSFVIDGLKLAMETTGAKKGFIAIKEKNSRALLSIKEHINDSNISIVELPDVYPIGDEFLLVEYITKKRVPVGNYPIQIGVIVNNIETLYFTLLGVKGEAYTHKFISVLGQVKKPGVYKVPIGARFRDILREAELLEEPYRLFKDGLMMGKEADLTDVVEKTTSVIFVLRPEVFNIVNPSIPIDIIKRRARSACERCMFCTELCPRYLLGYPIEPHRIVRVFSLSISRDIDEKVIAMAYNCSECGICELYACPMGLSPRQLNRYIKTVYKKPDVSLVVSSPIEYKDERQVSVNRLISRLSVGRYKVDSKCLYEIETDIVELPLEGYISGNLRSYVKSGDNVKIGQIVASGDESNCGVYNNICSPFDGMVVSVSERIVIERC